MYCEYSINPVVARSWSVSGVCLCNIHTIINIYITTSLAIEWQDVPYVIISEYAVYIISRSEAGGNCITSLIVIIELHTHRHTHIYSTWNR